MQCKFVIKMSKDMSKVRGPLNSGPLLIKKDICQLCVAIVIDTENILQKYGRGIPCPCEDECTISKSSIVTSFCKNIWSIVKKL